MGAGQGKPANEEQKKATGQAIDKFAAKGKGKKVPDVQKSQEKRLKDTIPMSDSDRPDSKQVK